MTQSFLWMRYRHFLADGDSSEEQWIYFDTNEYDPHDLQSVAAFIRHEQIGIDYREKCGQNYIGIVYDFHEQPSEYWINATLRAKHDEICKLENQLALFEKRVGIPAIKDIKDKTENLKRKING